MDHCPCALAVLIGIFVAGHSFLVAGVTTVTIMYIVGLAAIVLGILEIVAAIQDRKEIEGEGWLMLGGAMMIVLGVLLLMAPLQFGLLLVRILGIYAIIFGISQIVLSFLRTPSGPGVQRITWRLGNCLYLRSQRGRRFDARWQARVPRDSSRQDDACLRPRTASTSCRCAHQ